MDLQRHGPVLIVFLGVALFLGVRLSVFDVDLPNPDIAGILYNAELLLDGGLPYRDTAEIKPPGSFFIVAGLIGAFGRDLGTLQWVHTVWLLVGAPAIWLAVGSEHRLAAAIGTAVYLFYVGMFTYNYSSWMIVPYAWAFTGLVRSLERGASGWALGAGAATMLATLTIQRAGVLFLLAAALLVLGRRTGAKGATAKTAGLWTLGAAIPLLLVCAPYLAAGDASIVDGILPWSVATDYANAADGSLFTTLRGAVGQLFETFLVGVALVVLALIDGDDPQRRRYLLFFLVSVLGCALGGGRFYIHYLIQYVPALALLAAFTPRRPAVAALALLALGGAVVEVATGSAHRYEAFARRLEGGKTAAQAAGAHIAARTAEDETIFAWGWTAWRVYYWSGRRAPGRIYKPLGLLTTFNRNTAFEDGSEITFRPGPTAEAFIQTFDQNPPTYVILSPSYTQTFGATADPLDDFEPLRHRLATQYTPEALYGDLTLLRRR